MPAGPSLSCFLATGENSWEEEEVHKPGLGLQGIINSGCLWYGFFKKCGLKSVSGSTGSGWITRPCSGNVRGRCVLGVCPSLPLRKWPSGPPQSGLCRPSPCGQLPPIHASVSSHGSDRRGSPRFQTPLLGKGFHHPPFPAIVGAQAEKAVLRWEQAGSWNSAFPAYHLN